VEPVEKVSADALPPLEQSPGPTDNWVESAGGLPTYIDHIARHLHTEKGMTIPEAIATAVNQVKKWAAGGKNVNADTRAKAAAAVAEWEALKVKSMALSEAKAGVRAATKSLVPQAVMVDGESVPVEPVTVRVDFSAEGPALTIDDPLGRVVYESETDAGVVLKVMDRQIVWAPTADALDPGWMGAEIVFVKSVDMTVPDEFEGVLWPVDDAGTVFALAAPVVEKDRKETGTKRIFKRLWGPFANRES